MTTSEDRRRIPATVKLWRLNYEAKAKAKAEAAREAQREAMAGYRPANVRSYGEPWDSRIAAGALSAVPLSESPNRGSRR